MTTTRRRVAAVTVAVVVTLTANALHLPRFVPTPEQTRQAQEAFTP